MMAKLRLKNLWRVALYSRPNCNVYASTSHIKELS